MATSRQPPPNPRQLAAIAQCNAQRLAVERGDGSAVLACVRLCGAHGLVMPHWLAAAFNRRYDAVLTGKASSWGNARAFGCRAARSARLALVRWIGIEPIQSRNFSLNCGFTALLHVAVIDPTKPNRRHMSLNETQPKPTKLLRLPLLEERIGLKRATIYTMVKEGRLPAPVRLSARAVAWREEEIDQWIAARTTAAGQA